MLARIVTVAVEKRWLVLLLTMAAALAGVFAIQRLPIDAVPDITNVQVQVNAVAPALSPADVERQVTYPMETALAGIPGLESTRSLTRHGFVQITAVFTDGTDIWFARQQVGERLRSAQRNLPPGVTADLGPVATGLGDEGGVVLEGEVGPAEAGGEVGVAGGEGAAGAEEGGLGLVAGVEVLGRRVAVLADLPGDVGQQIVEEGV